MNGPISYFMVSNSVMFVEEHNSLFDIIELIVVLTIKLASLSVHENGVAMYACNDFIMLFMLFVCNDKINDTVIVKFNFLL